jgi:hypothetical protein
MISLSQVMLRVALGWCVACDGKVINADTEAPYLAKVHAGVSQALQWISEMVLPDAPPPRSPRTVRLALVGLGRTGSTSFVVALKELGYAPVHDDEMTVVSDVYAAMMRGTMSTDEVNAELGKRGFDAPFMSMHKYVEWAATAPDLKVILTVRDQKRWAESWMSIAPAAHIPRQRPFRWLPAMAEVSDFVFEIMINVATNGHPELYQDLPTLEAGYVAWVDFVRKTVPKERLLEFDVRHGWEPLCEFLGEPVPSQPFPHINDRVVVDTIVKVMVTITWIWPFLLAVPPLLLWCCVRCCCVRRTADASKKLA